MLQDDICKCKKKKILILKIFTMLIYGSYSVKKDDKKFFGMDLNGIIKV